jgi:hypothetical protein
MIEILRYWGKQVHKFAGIWFAVISRLTARNFVVIRLPRVAKDEGFCGGARIPPLFSPAKTAKTAKPAGRL